uniref:Flavodoxin-like domain-containing protein n=1 Tax=Chromera velia CCMP2878 TaxID=1169474 RepID=A0A0G4HJ72_9ALVE|eukprot:Cvel_1085.t1-p1 / transcript=Cvel_1085.t1 / gene=Cvel_1085 / organism=Chromera_velia_CCMP2878 / gene_product=Minor allergen Alt a 7, putative / transcript_product=Minor allergen Alt a 7, putative / location=Cvel_scaffold35:72559-75057(-) / protein_length=238 / sequence_SO=supercontig / SO=protein_coding / is_pseudo=false
MFCCRFTKHQESEVIVPQPVKTTAEGDSAEGTMANIAVVYYSMYGHIKTMAQAVQKGIESAGGKCTVYQVAETLPEEALKKMGAPPKDPNHPIMDFSKVDELASYDGILFGSPTRFGMISAQMKTFFDSTGGAWMKGAFVGKPAGFFFSTGTQGGGQETTALTFLTQLTHHGMIFVPIGYGNSKLMDMTETHGGSPYGAGCLAGPDGSRQPSALELDVATYQGEYFTKKAIALKKGSA